MTASIARLSHARLSCAKLGVEMESFVVLALAAVGIAIVLPIVCLVWIIGLNGRVRDLEMALKSSKAPLPQDTAPANPLPSPWNVPQAAPTDLQTPVKDAPKETVLAAPPLAATSAQQSSPRPISGPNKIDVWAARAMAWLATNWVYAVAGASLAFAGIFFVQYGIEHGILSPTARVLSGMAFGFALMAGGIYAHRQSLGDDAHQLIPSVLIGAGLVSVFAATLAARQLYGLIGPQIALILHVITALAAVGFGWVFGPILVALGLGGGFIAPFVVGGRSDQPETLLVYFLLLAAVGLGVDYLRRWQWVSALALALGYLGVVFVGFGPGSETGLIIALLALLAMAIILPSARLMPQLDGNALFHHLHGGAPRPQFAALLAMAANLAVSATLVLVSLQSSQPLALIVLWGMAMIMPFWQRHSPALEDSALVPTAASLGVLAIEVLLPSSLSRQFLAERAAESAAPITASAIMLAAAALAWVFHLHRTGALATLFASLGAAVLPLSVLLLEFGFSPARVLGPYPWALHVMAAAGAMVWLAFRLQIMGNIRAMALAALGVLSLIALAMFTVATGTALTLALATLIVAAAWLDRRYDLREMSFFGQLALAVVGYRLLADPGIDWALEAPIWQVILVFTGALAAIWRAMVYCARAGQHMTLQTALLALGATFADVLILRAMDAAAVEMAGVRYALLALPWLVLALSEGVRAVSAQAFARVHLAIAGLSGAAAGGLMVLSVAQSPLTSDRVIGSFLLDTAFVSYVIPAAILLAALWKLRAFSQTLRQGLGAVAGALLTLYAIIEIRRFWNGDLLIGAPLTQPELYTYTLALMGLGAGLIHLAIRQQSENMRRIGMAVIGLTVVKVFFWDAAGLSGLTRVASFAGLGLALLGLAQLNRWAASKTLGAPEDRPASQ